jgi:hypothetical protein
MATIYTQGRILVTHPETGEVEIEWSDPTQPDSPKLFLAHKLPPAAETVGWTRDDFMQFFSAAVENAEDIPDWMFQEEIQSQRDILREKRREVIQAARGQ